MWTICTLRPSNWCSEGEKWHRRDWRCPDWNNLFSFCSDGGGGGWTMDTKEAFLLNYFTTTNYTSEKAKSLRRAHSTNAPSTCICYRQILFVRFIYFPIFRAFIFGTTFKSDGTKRKGERVKWMRYDWFSSNSCYFKIFEWAEEIRRFNQFILIKWQTNCQVILINLANWYSLHSHTPTRTTLKSNRLPFWRSLSLSQS